MKLMIDHGYKALFGTMKDGLPLMGKDPETPNHFYILGYEGNGTCCSMAGAEIIMNLMEGKTDQILCDWTGTDHDYGLVLAFL